MKKHVHIIYLNFDEKNDTSDLSFSQRIITTVLIQFYRNSKF